MRSILSAFVALGALQALTVTAQDPACLAKCGSQVRADFTKYGCVNADDAGCLCASADFKAGVKDCSSSCGSADGDADTFLNDGFCLAQAPPAEEPSSEPSSEPAPQSTEAPEPEATGAPDTTSAAESTTAVPEEEPEQTPIPESTEELAEESSTEPAQPETTIAPESTTAPAEAESTTILSTSQTSAAADAGETSAVDNDDDKNDEKDKNEDKDEGGLSQATIIGIGVGVGAAGLAAIGLLVWLCLRRRSKKDSRPFIEISKPMPASGAGDYTGRRDPFAEKRGDVFEMQSNRYEDMLPRQEPRTVV